MTPFISLSDTEMNDPILMSEADGILEVVLNGPQKCNAISDAMLKGLRDAVCRFGKRRDLRVMLIRGIGKYFSAGVEISLSPSSTSWEHAGTPSSGSTHCSRAWGGRYRFGCCRHIQPISACSP